MFDLDRREATVLRQHRFSSAEKKHATVVEGELKPAENLRLRLGVEIHQGISTDEHVDVRDRGVLNQVVTPEDHLTSQILPKDVPIVNRLEVARKKFRWNTSDLTFGIGRL